jgi:uncharacterized surface protein with fasciclin (FAS1) repeats
MRRFIAAFTAGALALGIVAGPALAKQPAKSPTIVDVAIAVNADGPFAGSFDTLIAAVLAADPAVATALTSNGQLTVFAPTDAAFAELGLNEGNIGGLPQDALTNILLFHVAKGERYAADVVTSSRIRMLNGDFAMVDGATIDGANVIVPDVDAPTNGIIHVVDAVLLP